MARAAAHVLFLGLEAHVICHVTELRKWFWVPACFHLGGVVWEEGK